MSDQRGTPFTDRLKELSGSTNFWKLCLYKVIWNLTSRKYQALVIAIILFACSAIDSLQLMITVWGYAGINVAEKLFNQNQS